MSVPTLCNFIHIQFLSFTNMSEQPSLLELYPQLRQTLELVSDKWATSVLYVLSRNKKRYGELKRSIGSVSQRMLTRTLQNLETNGLVSRNELSTVPLIVEYSLTPLGETLVEPLIALCQWWIDHSEDVEAARAQSTR